MTPDREQIRRDAAYKPVWLRTSGEAVLLARHCLALLSELVQAERACNICGKAWPNHEPACAYLANVQRAEQAERERDEARERTRQADRLSADLLEELQKHGLRL